MAEQLMQVAVPAGVRAGQAFQIALPGGRPNMMVTCPAGSGPGQLITIRVPPPAAAAAPAAAPVAIPVAAPSAPPAPSGAPPTEPRALRVPSTPLEDLAENHAECSICFEFLCSEPCGVFVDGRGRRTCPHFFHDRCIRSMPACANCPLCRREFVNVLAVPDIRQDPQGWFKAVDQDGNGHLDMKEVLHVLRAQVPVDHDALEDHLPKLWKTWDPNGDGFIQYDEIMRPEGGLLAYVLSHFARKEKAPPPRIEDDKHAWFEYWDEDGSGELEQIEVVRAVIKSFGLSADVAKVEEMKSIVQAVWCIFDDDGGGSIDRSEFVRADGLADAIIASKPHAGK